MKRLLLLLLLALPTYAYATVWQLTAVDKDFPSRVATGQFVEDRGVLREWDFNMFGYELRGNLDGSVVSDCGAVSCITSAKVIPPRTLVFNFEGASPGSGRSIALVLTADLGATTIVHLVPGQAMGYDEEHNSESFQGSTFDIGPGYLFGSTYLLTGTITAVPEPSIIAIVLVLLVSLPRFYKHR